MTTNATSGLTNVLCAGCPDLPVGIRHLCEPSTLEPGMNKMERETLWHIAHALSILLHRDFKAGVQSYASLRRQAG